MKLMTDVSSDTCSVSGECIILMTVHIHLSGICEYIRELFTSLFLFSLYINIRS